MFHFEFAKVDLNVAHVASGYTRMFQVYVPNVSSHFPGVCVGV